MAKKIRFPLIMEKGIEVRDIVSLRTHFSLPSLIEYKKNGKLVTWLRDRYETELATAVELIDDNDSQIAQKLCEVFGVEYTDKMSADIEKAAERSRRIEELKKYTNSDEFIRAIDNVAFNQDDLFDLLDEDQEEIYLCGERFSIPLSKTGMTYIGINNPVVVIDSTVEVDWSQKGIVLKDIVFDENYQKVLDRSKEVQYASDKKRAGNSLNELPSKKNNQSNRRWTYKTNSITESLLSSSDRAASIKSFEKLSKVMDGLKYDIDYDIRNIKASIKSIEIVGLGQKYIERL